LFFWLFLIFVVAFCYEMSESQRSEPNRTGKNSAARTTYQDTPSLSRFPFTRFPFFRSPFPLRSRFLWPTPAPFRHGKKYLLGMFCISGYGNKKSHLLKVWDVFRRIALLFFHYPYGFLKENVLKHLNYLDMHKSSTDSVRRRSPH